MPKNEVLIVSDPSIDASAFINELCGRKGPTAMSHPIWHISNKYYEADISFRVLYDFVDALDESSKDVQVLIFLLPGHDAIDPIQPHANLTEDVRDWLRGHEPAIAIAFQGETDREEVDTEKTEKVREAIRQLWLDIGFEYIDVASQKEGSIDASSAEAEGFDRVREALSAHIWPEMSLRGHVISAAPALIEDAPSREASFDDDFDEFVIAQEAQAHSPLDNDDPLYSPSFQSTLDSGHSPLTDLPLERLRALREQASQLPDAERREFAAQIALSLAAGL